MVQKEHVYSWFQSLSAPRRVDFLSGLLHMCHPLELRFVGSCVEDMAKRSFNKLRDAEIKANSAQEVGRLKETTLQGNIADERTRSKINIYLALVYSTNRQCSSILYDILTSLKTSIDNLQMPIDVKIANELMLMMTIAVNHPVFSFEQRRVLWSHFHVLSELLQEYITMEDRAVCNHELREQQGSPALSSQPPTPVHVKEVVVLGCDKKPSDSSSQFLMKVTWSNGAVTEITRTYQELHDFHYQLISLFPGEAGAHKQNRKIPYLIGQNQLENNHKDNTERLLAHIREYTMKLAKMPLSILHSQHVTKFFQDDDEDKSAPSSGNHESTPEGDDDPSLPMKSFVVYNSKLSSMEIQGHPVTHNRSVAVPVSTNYGAQTTTIPTVQKVTYTNPGMNQNFSPLCSPLPSPLSSPHVSPSASVCSRPTSPLSGRYEPDQVAKWLKSLRLHKYSKELGRFSFLQLYHMSEEELRVQGKMTDGGSRKLKAELDKLISKSKGINGMVSPVNDMSQRTSSPASPSTYHTPPSYSPHYTQIPSGSEVMRSHDVKVIDMTRSPQRVKSSGSSDSEEYSSPPDSPWPDGNQPDKCSVSSPVGCDGTTRYTVGAHPGQPVHAGSDPAVQYPTLCNNVPEHVPRIFSGTRIPLGRQMAHLTHLRNPIPVPGCFPPPLKSPDDVALTSTFMPISNHSNAKNEDTSSKCESSGTALAARQCKKPMPIPKTENSTSHEHTTQIPNPQSLTQPPGGWANSSHVRHGISNGPDVSKTGPRQALFFPSMRFPGSPSGSAVHPGNVSVVSTQQAGDVPVLQKNEGTQYNPGTAVTNTVTMAMATTCTPTVTSSTSQSKQSDISSPAYRPITLYGNPERKETSSMPSEMVYRTNDSGSGNNNNNNITNDLMVANDLCVPTPEGQVPEKNNPQVAAGLIRVQSQTAFQGSNNDGRALPQFTHPPPSTSPASKGCISCGCPGQCRMGPQIVMIPQGFGFPFNIPTSNGIVNPAFPFGQLLSNGFNVNMAENVYKNNGMPSNSSNYQRPSIPMHYQSVAPGGHTFTYGTGPNTVYPNNFAYGSNNPHALRAMNPPQRFFKKPSCYNCGQNGHKAIDCRETTMQAAIHTGDYRLNYRPKSDAELTE